MFALCQLHVMPRWTQCISLALTTCHHAIWKQIFMPIFFFPFSLSHLWCPVLLLFFPHLSVAVSQSSVIRGACLSVKSCICSYFLSTRAEGKKGPLSLLLMSCQRSSIGIIMMQIRVRLKSIAFKWTWHPVDVMERRAHFFSVTIMRIHIITDHTHPHFSHL